uniref:Uncharacterized protein n=1 Tax=Arundo donax TaxID=35708 RepID=A0A0A8ZVG8_ARUDO
MPGGPRRRSSCSDHRSRKQGSRQAQVRPALLVSGTRRFRSGRAGTGRSRRSRARRRT